MLNSEYTSASLMHEGQGRSHQVSTKQRIARPAPIAAGGLGAMHERAYYARQRVQGTGLGFVLAGEAVDQIAVWRDSPELATFRRYVASADVVIDIGANVGVFTCLAAQA